MTTQPHDNRITAAPELGTSPPLSTAARADDAAAKAAPLPTPVADSTNASAAQTQAQKPLTKEEKKASRTVGLRIFDIALYPIINNVAVFVISVAATYLTSHGNEVGGKFGQWMFKRGKIFKEKAALLGIGEKQADMWKMVFFSFADGSIMALPIKLLEDRRESIAKWIDTGLGTRPADNSVYEQEPKQSWTSVFLGRLLTSAVVVPTALAMDKITINQKSLNDHLFNDRGYAWGEAFVKRHPDAQKYFPRIHFPYLFKTGVFEAFYTSVCTGGLYFISRFIATFSNRVEDRREAREQRHKAREEGIHSAGISASDVVLPNTAREQKTDLTRPDLTTPDIITPGGTTIETKDVGAFADATASSRRSVPQPVAAGRRIQPRSAQGYSKFFEPGDDGARNTNGGGIGMAGATP